MRHLIDFIVNTVTVKQQFSGAYSSSMIFILQPDIANHVLIRVWDSLTHNKALQ